MNTLKLFQFGTHGVNVQTDADGQPWFNAGDVCAALEIENPRAALLAHVDSEDVVKRDTLTAGGRQLVNHVNESGLYALIFGSTKEAAVRFKRWVTSEVLPSIRQTGSYAMPGTTRTPVAEVDEDWQRASKIRAAKTTFTAIVQVTRVMGMHHSRSLKAANRASIRHHGVDMIQETDAHDLLQQASLPGTSSADSLAAFLFDLTSGTLGIDLVPCLTTDLERLYKAWCRRNQSRPYNIARLTHCINREFRLPIYRKRYCNAAGTVVGPASVTFLGGNDLPPDGVTANDWHGTSIASFRDQVERFEASDGAIARAA